MPVTEEFLDQFDATGEPRETPVFHAWLLRWTNVGFANPTTSRLRIVRPLRVVKAASGVMNWNDVGAWQVAWHVENYTGSLPRKGDYMLFSYGAETLMSGPITECVVRGGKTQEFLECEAKGVTEEVVLKDRLVLPDPDRWAEAQTTQSHDRRSGVASSVMIGYALDHTRAGDPIWGTPTRDYGKLEAAPDPLLGPNISMSERYSGLLDTLQRAALKANLGFRVTRPRSTLLPTFEVSEPRDRSAIAVFTNANKTLEGFEWKWESPELTAVVAGGQGELTARMMAERTDDGAARVWRRRIEKFRDQRSEDNITQLRSDNIATLDDGIAKESVSLQPAVASRIEYGEHYVIGDLVCAQIYGPGLGGGQGSGAYVNLVDRVTQVKWSATFGHVRFSPVVGVEGESDLTGAASRALAKRIRQIEGAQ